MIKIPLTVKSTLKIMLYADDFEEELRKEYGKIFHNIAYIRARKLGDRENNPRKDKKEDILSQATSYEKRYEEDIELRRDKWPVQGANRWESDIMSDGVNTKPLSPKAQSAKDTGPWEGESQTFQSDPSLYEKVAQDLETVFSRCAMVNPTVNSFRTEGMEGEKNAENSLHFPNKNCVEMRRHASRNEIQHKIVHTRNDTLHIWSAHV